MLLFIDDQLIGVHLVSIEKFKYVFFTKFKIKDMDDSLLGIEIIYTLHGVLLSHHLILNLLKFGMMDCKPIMTLFNYNLKIQLCSVGGATGSGRAAVFLHRKWVNNTESKRAQRQTKENVLAGTTNSRSFLTNYQISHYRANKGSAKLMGRLYKT